MLKGIMIKINVEPQWWAGKLSKKNYASEILKWKYQTGYTDYETLVKKQQQNKTFLFTVENMTFRKMPITLHLYLFNNSKS